MMKKNTAAGPFGAMVLSLFLFAGCSKPQQPVQAPVQQEVKPAAGADAPDEMLSLEPDDKTGDLFNEYVRQLKAGDLIQASANLAILKSQIHGEDLNDPFWIDHLPPESRVTLLIGALCTNCSDGSCPTCKGRKACQTCLGNGLCKGCEGRGGEWIACQQCVCKTCSGSRFCMECKGRRFLTCSTCSGTGNGREEQKFEPCPSCGGRGYKEGLKGPNNTQNKVRCIRCNGSKGIYTTARFPCASCDGNGRKNCGTCRATGVCPVCRGVGRTADCSVCAGQGRYLDPCEVCQGNKACPDCSGSKLCQACQGRGACKECQGKNLVIRYRMPIDKRWLVFPLARAIRPSSESLVQEPVTGSTATFVIESRSVAADIPEGSILWASTPQDLRRISGLFIQ